MSIYAEKLANLRKVADMGIKTPTWVDGAKAFGSKIGINNAKDAITTAISPVYKASKALYDASTRDVGKEITQKYGKPITFDKNLMSGYGLETKKRLGETVNSVADSIGEGTSGAETAIKAGTPLIKDVFKGNFRSADRMAQLGKMYGDSGLTNGEQFKSITGKTPGLVTEVALDATSNANGGKNLGNIIQEPLKTAQNTVYGGLAGAGVLGLGALGLGAGLFMMGSHFGGKGKSDDDEKEELLPGSKNASYIQELQRWANMKAGRA